MRKRGAVEENGKKKRKKEGKIHPIQHSVSRLIIDDDDDSC